MRSGWSGTAATIRATAPIIAALIALGVLGASTSGMSAVDPGTGQIVTIKNALSPALLANLLVGAPAMVTAFPPLGVFLLLALGSSVAERSGLYVAMVRGGLAYLPGPWLTPTVFVTGLLAHQASDALIVVYLPLAGAAFEARGRDPILGVLTGFAAFSGAFAANLTPGIQDIVLLQLTEDAARNVAAGWLMNPLGNWYISLALAVAYTVATWLMTDLWLERRGFKRPQPLVEDGATAGPMGVALGAVERVGLGWALAAGLATGLALIGLIRLGAAPSQVMPGVAGLQPYFRALPAILTLALLSAGGCYGALAGALSGPAAMRAAMIDGLARLAPFTFAAILIALGVATLHASHLDTVLMLKGGAAIADRRLSPLAALMILIVLTAAADLLIGSATAKWAILAPIVVPMLMSAGLSPEMSTAAYRVGDGPLNILSPLQPCLALVLMVCRRWRPRLRMADILPYLFPLAAVYLLIGSLIIQAWALSQWSPGPYARFDVEPAPQRGSHAAHDQRRSAITKPSRPGLSDS